MKATVTARIERAKLVAVLKGLPRKQETFIVRGEWQEVGGPCSRVEVDGKVVEDPEVRAKVAAVLPFTRPGEAQNGWRQRNARAKKKAPKKT